MHTHVPAKPFTQLVLLRPTLLIKPAKALKKERASRARREATWLQ